MRKVEIKDPVSEETDWDIPQWVQNTTLKDVIVLTTGEHDGIGFDGTCLPCKEYPSGHYATNWSKRLFTRLEGVVPFEISND
jgi:hypothetical protein